MQAQLNSKLNLWTNKRIIPQNQVEPPDERYPARSGGLLVHKSPKPLCPDHAELEKFVK